MAGDRLVKMPVLERDGEEISWTEEINPYRDIPQTGGIQIDEVLRTRILKMDDGEEETLFAGLQSIGLGPRRIYTRDMEFDFGWWLLQTHPQDIVDKRVRVPVNGQYLIDGGKLTVNKNGAIWLEKGAKIIVRK